MLGQHATGNMLNMNVKTIIRNQSVLFFIPAAIFSWLVFCLVAGETSRLCCL